MIDTYGENLDLRGIINRPNINGGISFYFNPIETLLHWAVIHGHADTFLAYGAKSNARDKNGGS